MIAVRSLLAGLAMLVACGRAAAAEPAVEYLADILSDRAVSAVTGWGELGVNTGVKPADRPAMKLRIKDKEYVRGLGHHANGEIVFDLGGLYRTFEVEIGIQWQGGQNQASAVFQVFVDGEKRFDSGVVHENDPPKKISVPIEGAEELRLVAGDAGDGITCDCADWAEARLVRHPHPPRPAAVKTPVDIAAFARVMTWDPRRMEGTKAGRVEEFPAGDVFLGTEVLPAGDGCYTAPRGDDGTGCLGLQWDEQRLLRQVAIEWADPAAAAGDAGVQAQYWIGESAWQGQWKALAAPAEKAGARWTWRLGFREIPRGAQKVRWLFPAARAPVVLKAFSATSRASWAVTGVRIESARPASAGRIALYNGTLVDPPAGASPLECRWDRAAPLSLRVRHSVPKPYKADRTVLRFELPDSAFAVAIEDLLANDCVWVARAGVFVSREPAPVQLGEYLRRISDRKTVLQQVRERPEQTLEKAMAAVHNPVQDLGPVMLSLSCDNRKFIVERDGTVVFDLYSGRGDPAKAAPDQCRMTPRFGGGPGAPVARRMLDGWPIIAIDTVAGGVSCRQSTCVTGKGVCVAAFELERPRSSPGDALAPLAIGFSLGRRRLAVRPVGDRLLCIADGDRLVAAVRSIGDGLALEAEEGGVSLAGRLPPGGTCLVLVAIPAYHLDVKDGNCLESISLTRSRTDTHDYWRQILEPAMDVRLPDRLLSDVVRLSQIHCMMAARSEEGSQRIAPWISADRYGPLESEANSILRGLGMWGHDEFARRGFDYFVHRYNRAGYLTTGYTIVGTGWHLWTLAEHYERTQDRAWLQSIAPEVARVCRWVVRQRTKTQRLGPRGEKAPEHGLMPPGVTADWNRYSYRFFNDAQYCAGLEAAVGMLASIGHPDAPALRADAEAYRRDIVRAYRHAQARSPVVRIGNGTWAPYAPSMLDCFGNVEEFFPAEDWNRSWAGSVEIGAHHLAATGVLDPEGPETDWMLDYLEDHQFLRSGMGDYPEERNRKDPFNLGGFAKVQPYYGRTAEIYARRDDVRAFLRAYFNAIPSLLSRENLSFWEHFHNTGGWNKTHETGWFLCQSRLMLVQERGEQLWLAPMVPAAWFRDGGEIAVKNAPTRFGRAGYRICSSAAGGVIEATVDPPSRKPPKEIVLRLRHPEGKPIRAAAVQGKPHRDFDARKECVRFAPEGRPITIRAEF